MKSTDYQQFWTNPSIAFVGHTAKGGFPKISFGEAKAQGREVYAVDPSTDEVLGEKAYPDFESLPAKVAAAVIEVPKEETRDWVEKAADAGIEKIWIHMARDTPEAVALAEERGLTYYTGTCAVMYLKQGFSYHSIHRWIMKLLGKY